MGLRENILCEPVTKLPLRKVVKVKRTETVKQVTAKMRKAHMGCAILVGANGKTAGKFTERLLVKLLVKSGTKKLSEPVWKHSYSTADTLKSTEPIARVVQLMQSKRVRFVTVVDEKGRPVGIAGQKGLIEYIIEHFGRQVKVRRLEPLLSMSQAEGG